MNIGAGESPLQAGQRLDRYELLLPLVRGVAASLWVARVRSSAGFDKLVAIKAIHAPLASEPRFREAFLEEVRLASAITHPNVAQVLDLGERPDLLYVVREYVDGDALFDLRAVVEAKRLKVPPAIVLRIVADACAGLHAAHLLRDRTGKLLNVVHGDVSSHAILVSTNGVTKVVDFGVAKATARIAGAPNGRILADADHDAPPLPMAQRLDRHADIWAIGAVLHQFLAHLIVGLRATGDDPGRAPSVPGAVVELVHRALSSVPSERFATAAEMQGAIEAAMVSLGIPTTTANVAAFAAEHLAERAAARAQAIDLAIADAPTQILDSLGPTAHTVPPNGPPNAMMMPTARALVPPAPPTNVTVDAAAIAPTVPSPSQIMLRPPSAGPMVRPLRRRLVTTAAVAASSAIALAAAGLIGMQIHKPRAAAPRPPTSAAAAAPVASAPPKPSCPAGMVEVPGGKFFMGSDDDLDLEKPAHHVTLSPYCIDTFEVTVEQYKQCSDAGDCKRAAAENKWDGITKEENKIYDPLCNVREPMGRARHPINCVDWQMAERYCEIRGGRLPTEAEWEFAARGPDGRKYPWGDEEPSALELNACGRECVAWGKKKGVTLEAMYEGDDGWPNTAPVGSFPGGKSRYGVQDVVGNVWEWTGDWFAPYGPEALIDPKGPPTGDARVIRGGAWNGAYASWVRPTFRYRNAPDTRSHGIGFRCARALTD